MIRSTNLPSLVKSLQDRVDAGIESLSQHKFDQDPKEIFYFHLPTMDTQFRNSLIHKSQYYGMEVQPSPPCFAHLHDCIKRGKILYVVISPVILECTTNEEFLTDIG